MQGYQPTESSGSEDEDALSDARSFSMREPTRKERRHLLKQLKRQEKAGSSSKGMFTKALTSPIVSLIPVPNESREEQEEIHDDSP